jgi:hypothetical protein
VMDCEGFGGMDESENHDTRIFLFALLLSSYFVYNSVGSIDENALQTLSLVVNLAKDVKMKMSENAPPSEEEIAENFPSFLWIVRDFALRLVDANDNAINSKQYLESALALQKGCSESVENKNRIRRLLKHFFRERDCVTMVRPVELEQELQQLDSLPDSFLREEFLQQAISVRAKIMKKTKPKSVNGKQISSEMFLHLANAYTTAINNGKVPTIESAWNYVCKEKANDTAKVCLAEVEKIFRSDEEITQLMKIEKDWKGEILRRQIAKFNQSKFADSADLKERQAILEKEILEKLNSLERDMEYEQTTLASKWLESEFLPIDDLIKQNLIGSPANASELMQQIEDNFHKNYQSIPSKQREKFIRHFRQEKESKILSAIVRSKEEEQRKEKELNRQLLLNLEQEALSAKSVLNEENSKLSIRLKELEEQNSESRISEAKLNQQLASVQAKSEEARNTALEKERQLQGELESRTRNYEEIISRLKDELNAKENSLLRSQSEQSKLESMLKQQEQLTGETVEAFKKRLAEMEALVQEHRRQEAQLNAIIKELKRDDEVRELREQLETMKIRRRQLENEVGEVRMEKQYLENQLGFYKEQIDDNKKLQDTLLGALQQQLKVEDDSTASELLSTNKHLGATLAKAEARLKALETKLSRYKLYKQIVSGAKAFQCKETGKLICKNSFLAHLQSLENSVQNANERGDSADSGIKNSGEAVVKINQTLIKECTETGKTFTEYLMQVKMGKGVWKVSRTYREFCDLNHAFINQFPGIKLPSSSNQVLGFGGNLSTYNPSKKRSGLEDRRLALQEYLNDLFKIPQIASCSTLRDFLKIDIYAEDFGASRNEAVLRSPLKRQGSICGDITSAYKNVSSLEEQSGKKQYQTLVPEYRGGSRLLKEN